MVQPRQPQRCLLYIKAHYPAQTFLTTLHYLFHLFWSPPNADLTTPEAVARALADVPAGFAGPSPSPSPGSKTAVDGKKKLFTAEQVRAIVAAATEGEEMKSALKRVTQEALDKGAFGAPWLWVSDGNGGEEPFFGSDR